MGVLAKPIPFGDYFLLEKLNTGGMAEVYKAKTFGVEGFERIVAVKKILPSISEDKEFISMFIDEAKIAGQLTHANIAQIYDLGNINDDYYIALEYVAGHDLRVIYDRCVRTNRKLDIGCVCYIVSKICEGLDYAHNKKDANGEPMNIIHRDISPQNILISYEGDCKLIDFGIAKATNKSSATQVGILKGKFSYMSPEQVSGKTNLDRRSDVFALGIVLFEMLTLKRLFLGASDFETLEKIRKVEVSPPTLYNSEIHEDLEDIVLKALAKDVNLRYQSANELQEALQRFMFKQNIYYTAKDLSEFMSSMFAQEIALEQKKSEFYKELTRDVLAQSKQPSVTQEDETSFYDKQNVHKMSGVQYEAVNSQPAPKQAIYAELDGFEPPRDNIVYSQKNQPVGVDNNNGPLNVNDIVTASVTNGKPHAVPRKSISMDPIVINKNRATIMNAPIASSPTKKKSSRNVFITIAIALVFIILCIIGAAIYKNMSANNTGALSFKITPNDVPVMISINDGELVQAPNLGAFDTDKKLSTTEKTSFRITAPGYEDYVATALATEDGQIVEIELVPQNNVADNNVLKLNVNPDMAEVTVDGVTLSGNHKFTQKGLSAGEHEIRITKDGYKPLTRKILLPADNEFNFDLKPAVAALIVKTEPYSAKFELHNLTTHEVKQGETGSQGRKFTNLNVDDSYKIVIFDGNDKQEYTWIPEVRNLPNEEQTRTFTTKVDPNAVAAAPAPQQPTTNVAQAAAPAAPKADKPKVEKPKTEKPKEQPAEPVVAEKPKPAAPAAPAANSDAPGILQVIGKPPCEISINGKTYGSTPKKIEIAPGSYAIKCGDKTQNISLGGGDVKKVLFN